MEEGALKLYYNEEKEVSNINQFEYETKDPSSATNRNIH